MSHGNQERIVHSWMRYVTHQAGEHASHDVEVAEVLHQFTLFSEVMEVTCQVNYFGDIVKRVLLVGLAFDVVQQVQEVLICYRELFQQAILLK